MKFEIAMALISFFFLQVVCLKATQNQRCKVDVNLFVGK